MVSGLAPAVRHVAKCENKTHVAKDPKGPKYYGMINKNMICDAKKL